MKFLAVSLVAMGVLVVPGMAVDGAPGGKPPAMGQLKEEELKKELVKRMIEKLEFKEASLRECVGVLKKLGVPAELGPDVAEKADLKFTLALRQVSAMDAVKYVANAWELRYLVVDGKVLFQHWDKGPRLKEWRVPVGFFGKDGPPKGGKTKAFLEKMGVKFGDKTSATYLADEQILLVNNVDEELDKVEFLVEEFLTKEREK